MRNAPLLDPFGRSRLPAGYTREHRIQLVGEVFQALIDGRLPSREAALFVGCGGMGWLCEGGDLLRDFWKIVAPRSSHRTPSRVWRACSSEGATADSEPETMDPIDIIDGSSQP